MLSGELSVKVLLIVLISGCTFIKAQKSFYKCGGLEAGKDPCIVKRIHGNGIGSSGIDFLPGFIGSRSGICSGSRFHLTGPDCGSRFGFGPGFRFGLPGPGFGLRLGFGPGSSLRSSASYPSSGAFGFNAGTGSPGFSTQQIFSLDPRTQNLRFKPIGDFRHGPMYNAIRLIDRPPGASFQLNLPIGVAGGSSFYDDVRPFGGSINPFSGAAKLHGSPFYYLDTGVSQSKGAGYPFGGNPSPFRVPGSQYGSPYGNTGNPLGVSIFPSNNQAYDNWSSSIPNLIRIDGSQNREYFGRKKKNYNRDNRPIEAAADPVSVSTAYKALFASRPTKRNNENGMIPEACLSCGHKSRPIDGSIRPTLLANIPEEKLQIVAKPIVQLKHIRRFAPRVEREEEFDGDEDLEREKVSEDAKRSGRRISFSELGYEQEEDELGDSEDLGYSTSDVDESNYEDLGPPRPDYRPGRETFKEESEYDDPNDDTDVGSYDIDDSSNDFKDDQEGQEDRAGRRYDPKANGSKHRGGCNGVH